MIPVIVVGENEPRIQHITSSLKAHECVPLRNLKLNMSQIDQPLPSLLVPSVIVLDMEADAAKEVGYYLRRLKAAYYDSAVLVLLPFGDGESEQIAMDAGADDILMRPVSVNRLSLTLRNLSEVVSRRVSASGEMSMQGMGKNHIITMLNRDGSLKRFHHLEQEIIQYAVMHCQGHISQAARALGIGRSTLYRKMDAMETRMKFQERTKGRSSFSYQMSSAS